jgi:hypothetical protein
MNGQLKSASIGLLLASCALSFPAAALEFTWGDVEGSFNSQISIGSSWRMEGQDAQLVTPGNKPGFGLASTSTGDDGNLNFNDGDTYSVILKGVHDLELRKGDFGLLLRGKYWYDSELGREHVHSERHQRHQPDRRIRIPPPGRRNQGRPAACRDGDGLDRPDRRSQLRRVLPDRVGKDRHRWLRHLLFEC